MTPAVAALVQRSNASSLAINNTWELAPWADVLYAADATWWTVHAQTALKFAGIKVTAHESVPYRQVMELRNTGKEGFDPDPSAVRTGGNGGYTGVHIAAHGGAARILLCGFDMRGTHWHGPHPKPLRSTGAHTFRKWIRRFETLAPELKARGIEVLNCTPGSALKCFPFMDLEEALAPRALPAA